MKTPRYNKTMREMILDSIDKWLTLSKSGNGIISQNASHLYFEPLQIQRITDKPTFDAGAIPFIDTTIEMYDEFEDNQLLIVYNAMHDGLFTHRGRNRELREENAVLKSKLFGQWRIAYMTLVVTLVGFIFGIGMLMVGINAYQPNETYTIESLGYLLAGLTLSVGALLMFGIWKFDNTFEEKPNDS